MEQPRLSTSGATTISRADFSARFRFSEWRSTQVPLIAAGTYAIWDNTRLLYCGMAGRQFDPEKAGGRLRYGLYTRLASHASGRLSGDQFCVYVASRLIVPSLTPALLCKFESGELTLDKLTKDYIHTHLEYQFVCVPTSREAHALEGRCQRGEVFGTKPYFNPK
jgi:hypothetical protein